MKRNLNEYLQKCIKMCTDCNIPIKEIDSIVVDKAESRWGQCRHRGGKIIIGISYKLVDSDYSENDSGLINTIIHELLHTCPHCSNHGEYWKKYAARIKDKYGINIKRTSTSEEKEVKEVSVQDNPDCYKYVVKCQKCGHEWGYMRMGNVIKNTANYQHKKCGNGQLIRIK